MIQVSGVLSENISVNGVLSKYFADISKKYIYPVIFFPKKKFGVSFDQNILLKSAKI